MKPKPRKKTRLEPADVVAFVGLAIFAAGLWWAYKPAALIVVGALFLFYAWVTSRQKPAPEEEEHVRTEAER